MYNIKTQGDMAIVTLSGDVDLQTTAELKSEISRIQSINRLDIISSDVRYIDSSGVAVLLMARQHCISNRIELSLSSMSMPVFRVLQIAKLDKLLPIGDVVEIDAATGDFGIDAAVDSTFDKP